MGRFPRLRSFPTDGNLNVGYCLVAMEATDNSNDKRLTVPVEAAPDSVADKLNRLAYAGAESIGNEVTSRVQKSIDNPAELVVSGGQSYVAGTLLGALGKMPGPFKYLAGITGASLAAFSMKDELSQENLAKIGGTTQSIWDSKEDMDSKVLSMQKSFAPLVLDAGSLVLGVLTGKGLQKKKHNDNEHQSDFQWRMDGYETKRLKFNEFIYLLTTGQKCTTTRTEHKGSQFYWPWSGKAEEHKLYKKLEDAKTLYGKDSLATAEQRGALSHYYRRNGMIKEADYQLERSKQITDKTMSDLEAGQVDEKMALLPESYKVQVGKADRYFRKADKYSADAHSAFLAKNMDKSIRLYEKAALHYTVGLKTHPGRGDCVSDARANLDDTLGRVGHYHLEKGDLTSAYLAFKRLATKEDGTIDHGRSLSLAQVCERLKFHDEAEQLYRGYYGQNEIKGSDYWYTSHQRDALKGITRCLVKRGKLSEAKELGIQLKGLGALNHPIIGSWGYGLWAPRNKDKVDTIHHVLRNTISNHEHLEFVDLPVTLS